MQLINLAVSRLVLHEVSKRTDDKKKVTPEYGDACEVLDTAALDALRDRIAVAMTHSDRCVEMTIDNKVATSMVALVDKLADHDEALFVTESRGVADLLADAQRSRAIPGGVVVVFNGTVGVPSQRFVGIIKAEVHNGFMRELKDGKQVLKFLDKLLLTPQTKLYKIGFFLEIDPEAQDLGLGWKAFIYDETMTAKNKYGAAQYFYGGFLGLSFPASSARQTKQFHDLTKDFIQSLNAPEDQKVDLHNALVTYLRVDQSPTVETTAFATAYFGEAEIRDAYQEYMTQKGFPTTAVNKDLGDVHASLKLRKVYFGNQVRLIGPAEKFEKLVTIKLVDAINPAKNEPKRWTEIIVKDQISGQE
jgi:hypothetical protein